MNLTIDDRPVTGKSGQTILDVAVAHGINVPHLCTHSHLKPYGACRMCLVEVDGMRGYPPSCTTPATDGMVVRTNSEALEKLRRNVLSLTMLEHPNACLACGKRDLCMDYRGKPEKAGRTTGCHTCNNMNHCEVRDITANLGLSRLPVPPRYHARPLDRSNPFIDRDLNLCILCGRCVRICQAHHGASVIDFVKRGSQTHIGEAFGRSLQEAGCTFCGSCVDVCPTGTLSDRFAKWYGAGDHTSGTTCALCPQACAVIASSREGKLVSAKSASAGVPLCLLGRFAMAELLSHAARLRVPLVRVTENLREVTMPEAVEAAAEHLKAYRGEAFAWVCDTSGTVEDRYIYERFTREVMQSPHYLELTPDATGHAQTTLPEGVKAAVFTGPFVDTNALAGLECVIAIDAFPSAVTDKAYVVFPAAVLAETEGTYRPAPESAPRPLYRSSQAPGAAQQDWKIVGALAAALGSDTLHFASGKEIAAQTGVTGKFQLGDAKIPEPAHDWRLCARFYRGHRLADYVGGLNALEPSPSQQAPATTTRPTGKYEVRSHREIVPNTYELVIHAPEIAKRAKAGQFCIAMADETSERVPYTLTDWDAAAGTITLVILEKGQSSRKLALLRQGDALAHLAGPLGIPFDVKLYGRVMLAGGCYGVGAVLPVARALREAGNHVTVAVEARSHYLTYYGDKLSAACDEFIQTTIDGSMGMKGHAVDAIAAKREAGEAIDLVVAIGCPFMMMIVSRETQPHNIPTLASLNPIMLDGTGMCGACRLTVGGKVKFACVDGPFFDAHQVDWLEVRDRREAYSNEEIQSVGLSAPVTVIENPTLHRCSGH